MHTYYGFPAQPPDRPTYLTIGNFDGVHRGHQALIADMTAAAHTAGALAGVITFDPHPLAVLRPNVPVSYLTTPAERADLVAALGADFILILPFTRAVADTSAADFTAALVRRLSLAQLWVGPDFALGHAREGNVERLAVLGGDLGYTLHVLPPFTLNGEAVRSSRVRTLLVEEGAVDRAAELLGRPYQVKGTVQRGAGRGKGLGYPTANVAAPADRVTPAYGVYACWAWLGDRGLPAAVSIGTRPTFDNGRPTVEAYLLDFEGDLYGQELGLSFASRLRPELRFADAAALIRQMDDDVAATRAVLGQPRYDAAVGDGGWQELPHTADWAIRVEARTQRELFARAAAAMFALEDADPAQPVKRAHAVNLMADTPADLMVGWLNRLLLGQEVAGEMYTRFALTEISDRGLRGLAYGYSGAPAHTQVKAVTYYDLRVEQTPAGWEAVITFDV